MRIDGNIKYKSRNLFFQVRNISYVARSFCGTIKLPKELPKIAKCLKCLIRRRRSIDFIFIKNKKQTL
jgi:hypothetical protein